MTTYSNPRMHAVIENWPYGAHRTTATFAIETHPKRGQRGTRSTIDPKTGRTSAVKTLTYTKQARIVDGDDGKTYIAELSTYGFFSIMRSDMKFQHETIWSDGIQGEQFKALLALFEQEPVT